MLSRWAIHKPVAALMLMLSIMVLGLVSLLQLQMDLLPKINPPVMAVLTELPGASADEVLLLVTEPVEAVSATVSGIKELRSVSGGGSSVVILQFDWDVSMADVRAELAEKLDLLPLPEEASRPQITRFDPTQLPLLQVFATAEGSNTLSAVTQRMEKDVKPRLEAVPGIAQVNLIGGVIRETRVNLDEEKLFLHRLAVTRVASIVAAGAKTMPLGTVSDGSREKNIRLPAQYADNESLRNLSVAVTASAAGNPAVLQVKDLATVETVYIEENAVTRVNGNPAVGLKIQKESNSNTVAVARSVRQELNKIQDQFPEMQLVTVLDQGAFIEESLQSSVRSLITGGIFALVVLLGFLGSLLSTIIVAIAIPFSVLSTFVLLFAMGMTLNIMTLGGLALGVGMFLDNSIVVIENIFRHMQEGKAPAEAAETGSAEVTGAISASTLTTIVVFLPVVFVGGLTGTLFRELAVTITLALLSSLLVSLTVIPLLASRWLRSVVAAGGRKRGRLRKPFFACVLQAALRRKAIVLLAALLLMIAALFQVPRIGSEFLPSVDEGVFNVDLRLQPGTPLTETSERVKRIEERLMALPDVGQVTVLAGGGGSAVRGTDSHTAQLLVHVKDSAQDTMRIMQEARELILAEKKEDEEIVCNLYTSLYFSPGSSADVLQLTLSGPDADRLSRYAEDVMGLIADVPGLSGIQNSGEARLPELHVQVYDDRALLYGLVPATVGGEVRAAVQGVLAGRLQDGEHLQPIRVRLDRDRAAPLDPERVPIETLHGIIRLSDVAEVRDGVGPAFIHRQGQKLSVEITGQVEGRDIGSVAREALDRSREVNLPQGYQLRAAGTVLLMREGFGSLRIAFLLSLVLIYMVMAAQFESLRSPLVIIFTVPLGAIGVVSAMLLTGTAFGITAFIGVIMLGGIVVNNGIVLVDFMEKLRSRDIDTEEAAVTAVRQRTRPVLMTALTTILGLMPMAARLGDGTELQAPLARVVIGGLLAATFLTLIIVPVLYALVYKKEAKIT